MSGCCNILIMYYEFQYFYYFVHCFLNQNLNKNLFLKKYVGSLKFLKLHKAISQQRLFTLWSLMTT